MTLAYNVKLKNLYGFPSATGKMMVYVGTASNDHEETIKKEIFKQWGNHAELDSYTAVKGNGRFNPGIGQAYGSEDK